MPNACLFCLKSSKSRPGLSSHKFITNPSLRSSLLKAYGFGILDSDNGPYRKLCSRHFEEDCFNGNIKRKSKAALNLLSSPNINKTFDTTQNSIIEIPKKTNSRKCFGGDIKTPDVDTPRRAKHHFKQSKIKVMNQRKKIKKLFQKVIRLQTKLSNIDVLLKHLKKK